MSIYGDRGVETETNVTRPDLDESLIERLAGRSVDNTNVEEEVNSALGLTNVAPDELVVDIVWSFSNFRSRHTRRLPPNKSALLQYMILESLTFWMLVYFGPSADDVEVDRPVVVTTLVVPLWCGGGGGLCPCPCPRRQSAVPCGTLSGPRRRMLGLPASARLAFRAARWAAIWGAQLRTWR